MYNWTCTRLWLSVAFCEVRENPKKNAPGAVLRLDAPQARAKYGSAFRTFRSVPFRSVPFRSAHLPPCRSMQGPFGAQLGGLFSEAQLAKAQSKYSWPGVNFAGFVAALDCAGEVLRIFLHLSQCVI